MFSKLLKSLVLNKLFLCNKETVFKNVDQLLLMVYQKKMKNKNSLLFFMLFVQTLRRDQASKIVINCLNEWFMNRNRTYYMYTL